ncbi:myo-inositol-1(or 4)-monophosphatase [Entomortierella parvispora]|uniref:Inositol-1-monophosphatase n=1 Tax=Entomortierella parvispora TaxID=205924 RepID=A0A9P3HJK2_9FUNG|nr:myo-inositol-1(or 4)-monophosphatase [Entomortierella parvispora]
MSYTYTTAELESYLDFGIHLAKLAGPVILEGFNTRFSPERSALLVKKGNTADLVTEWDQKVEKMVRAEIAEKMKGHSFIGEETVAGGEECGLTDAPTWIVDPIDGTTNFVHGFPFSCISIGLTINQEPVVGVIYNPMMNQLFTAAKGQGAYLSKIDENPREQGRRLPLSYPHPAPPLPSLSMALVAGEYGSDRKAEVIDPKVKSMRNLSARDPSPATPGRAVGHAHGIRCLGSAALNMMAVAQGQFDVYWEVGCWEWDVCAGIIIVRESGGVVVDGCGREVTDGQLLTGRRFLTIRGCCGEDGDTSPEAALAAQKKIAKEVWSVVEDMECPRK